MSVFLQFGPRAETHQLSVGGVTMRVVTEGEGPAIVFVPGGDQTAEAYSEQFSRLSDSFRCITYDPRGAGETQSPPPPWAMNDYAADCAAVIDAFAGGRATVCGLSLGGLVTQQTAIDFPDKVQLAIPMGTSAYIDGFTRDWMQAEIDLRKDGITLPDYFLAPHYAVYAFPAKALHEPELWEQLKASYTERFRDRDPQATIDQWEACLNFDCREDLKTCPVPMHVVAFSEDVQTAPVMCKVVSDLAQNGTFHEIPGLGHVSMTRHKPDVVAKKLREILSAELVQQ
ncbi:MULTISPECIES: alpha/beta fold hydrolase [unclassified Ruegeria]|uniref:alpha/beta fold hydrolase n=1 Tax=unclassified Ruegeria TaxID=2625375 RepID=UPI001489BF36|nr:MULTISPECIES: alpha/beta hydrolase [unclassified Ruegeria]NOD35786.1 alpha/beta fold hydrolase [Ruegeria sp. HKCCD7296]NOE34351.1 alpha/beta fold hydrolase [Ruegeria sp. HKCCD7318]NOE40167.1 alpha/beta fold hydrolase [Ruegeria sp. HKCCD7319]